MRTYLDTIIKYLKLTGLKTRYKICIYTASLCIILYLILVASAKQIETALSFPWVVVNTKDYTAPDTIIADLEFEEINITTKNGDTINGLFIDNQAEKTIYYFHGNGGEMKYFYSEIEYLSDLWYNVMSYDYPGYGKSTWTPHFENVISASEEFFQYITETKWVEESDIIVWWFSIWSGVSLEWAKDKGFDKLVLAATFASRYDIARENFGFTPQKFFFRPNSFISTENISLIDEPILMIHGNKDDIISIDQWKKVFKNIIAEEKYFIELDGWGHNGIISEYGDILTPQLQDFLQDQQLSSVQSTIGQNEKDALRDFVLKNRRVKSSDLKTDTSLTKFVNNKVPFETLSYIPENLVSVSSNYVYDAKGWISQLTQDTHTALQAMAKSYYDEFWEKMVVVSAYRSYAYQAGIKARGCPDNLCAKAWYSEHQSGLWVDFWSASSESVWKNSPKLWKNYEWLSENAHLYGFHNTYQKGIEIDGYEIEPWHWRYLWVDMATYLRDNDVTFAEFYYSLNQ